MGRHLRPLPRGTVVFTSTVFLVLLSIGLQLESGGGARANDILARVPNRWVEPSMGSLADLVRFSDQRESVNAIVRDYNIVQFARLAKTQDLFRRVAVENAGKYTVFAPVDSAFQSLPPFVLSYLQKSPKVLEKVLTNHVVDGEFFLADLSPENPLVSLEGSPLKFTFVGSNVEVNGANILKPHDILGVDGVLHLIDKVIVPEDVQLPPCTSRCREVISGDGDLAQLDNDAQSKFCSLQCATVASPSNKRFPSPSPFPLLQEKKVSESETEKRLGRAPSEIGRHQPGTSFLQADNQPGGQPGGQPVGQPGDQSQNKQFRRNQQDGSFFRPSEKLQTEIDLPVLPVARPLMERALASQYGTRAGGRLLDECTSDCIRQGASRSVIQTFAQRQLLDATCLDNCANLLQKTVAAPPDRRAMCMSACTAQNIDGDRCVLLCGKAKDEQGGMRTSMRSNCEGMCANAGDYTSCVSECANTRGEKSFMAGRPIHLVNDRQRAFFEARAAQYRK